MFKKLLLTGALVFSLSASVFAMGESAAYVASKKLDTEVSTLESGSDYFIVYDASEDADNKVDVALMGMNSAQSVTPDDSEGAAVNMITAGVTKVDVGAPVNDTNDYIVLPAIASVPVGHTIRVASNSGGAYEIRTPATSGTHINGVDSDGSQEYLAVDTEVHVFVKVSDTDGWVAHDLPAAGGVGAATTPN